MINSQAPNNYRPFSFTNIRWTSCELHVVYMMCKLNRTREIEAYTVTVNLETITKHIRLGPGRRKATYKASC